MVKSFCRKFRILSPKWLVGFFRRAARYGGSVVETTWDMRALPTAWLSWNVSQRSFQTSQAALIWAAVPLKGPGLNGQTKGVFDSVEYCVEVSMRSRWTYMLLNWDWLPIYMQVLIAIRNLVVLQCECESCCGNRCPGHPLHGRLPFWLIVG